MAETFEPVLHVLFSDLLWRSCVLWKPTVQSDDSLEIPDGSGRLCLNLCIVGFEDNFNEPGDPNGQPCLLIKPFQNAIPPSSWAPRFPSPWQRRKQKRSSRPWLRPAASSSDAQVAVQELKQVTT